MAAFVAADVTYLALNQRKLSDSRSMNRVRMTFGAGSETYATGGIPVSKGNLGCPTVIESMIIVDKGSSGYTFMYDQSAEKIIIFVAPAQSHKHSLTLTAGTAVLSMGLSSDSHAATINTLSISSTLTLTSPIVSATLAVSAMEELANLTDIATQVLEVEVIGW